MWALLRKETTTYFTSRFFLLLIVIFLLSLSSILWFWESDYNILNQEIASLDSYFNLLPWLYLFLVPALTMNVFSDEKKAHTLDLLRSRPITAWQILFSKYGSLLFFLFVVHISTICYAVTLWGIGDFAQFPLSEIIIKYLFSFFLIALFLSLSLCSSIYFRSLLSYAVSIVLILFLYNGFGTLISSRYAWEIDQVFTLSSRYHHYVKGVVSIDSVGYLLVLWALFLFLGWINLSWIARKTKIKYSFLFVVASSISLGLLSVFSFSSDFSSDGRFSLSEISKEVIKENNFPIEATLYLDGNIPNEFKELKQSIENKIDEINAVQQRVYINYVDPYNNSEFSSFDACANYLSSKGLKPIELRINKEGESSRKIVFPALVLKGNKKEMIVNLLDDNPQRSSRQNLNSSIEKIEYKLVEGIKGLSVFQKKKIAFLQGHDELEDSELSYIFEDLSSEYEIVRVNAESLDTSYRSVIVSNPKKAFTEKEKFFLDQYFMKGGSLLWSLNPVNVNLDSLSSGMTTIAFAKDLNLRDLLFKYGVRLNTDLVQDANCLKYPINTAPKGSSAKYIYAPWYFSPLLSVNDSHPIGKGVGQVYTEFVSPIEIVNHLKKVNATPLLFSSQYSKTTHTPVEISLSLINQKVDQYYFDKKNIPMAYLLEGEFSSVFQGRILGEWAHNSFVKRSGTKNKMIVMSAGDVMTSRGISENNRGYPPGYDRFSNFTFSNQDFVVNAIRYLTNGDQIMSLAMKKIQFHFFHKILKTKYYKWIQCANLLVPSIVFVLMSIFLGIILRRRHIKL